ncbi:MAG TPA: formyltransferase family protein [Terriglobales bacterium]|nr:formyltransferase family protein [Terriglobales bacterium]
MRVVVLCSSPYSETGCAMAARLAQLGYVPSGALTLPAADKSTLIRKLGQWGLRGSARYAWSKLAPRGAAPQSQVRNPHLGPALRHDGRVLRNLTEVAQAYGFPIFSSAEQNSPRAIAQLRQWSPDLAIFTGGDILRKPLLDVPRLGVINSHLALLPEIRGMSSPEWSLLCGVPLGVTIHFMDTGIDTGPILLRREFPHAGDCDSLMELRNRMIAFGIEMAGEAVAALDRGSLAATAQEARGEDQGKDHGKDHGKDRQFFVMHDRLKAQAARRLQQLRPAPLAGRANG